VNTYQQRLRTEQRRHALRTVVILVVGLAALGLLIWGITALDHHSARGGTVTAKAYVPAHDESTVVLVGKVIVPSTNHIPECWQLSFTDPDTGQVGTTCVPRGQYDQTPIGARY
jgi:hypothetical protein